MKPKQHYKKLPNVIMVSFDALRKDFLKVYNPTVPYRTVFERAAEQGVIFNHAYPSGNWTIPSHASMFSGLEPQHHYVFNWKQALRPQLPTVFSKARALGYQTAFFSSDGVQPIVEFEQDQFNIFKRTWSSCIQDIYNADQPWLVFWHFLETHAPYGLKPKRPPEKSQIDFDLEKEEFNYIRELICTDRLEIVKQACRDQLIKASAKVEQLWNRLGENTVVLFFSDHGEDWRPYFPFHCSFEEPVLQIPLVVHAPGLKGSQSVDDLVAHCDYFSLIETLAGWPRQTGNCSPKGFTEWQSFSAKQKRVIICGPHGFKNKEVYFVSRDNNCMVLLQPTTQSYQTYLIKNGEQQLQPKDVTHPLTDIHRQSLADVMTLLKADLRGVEIEENPEEIIEHLKSLGYI